jgi:hypothetical protein
MPSGSLVRISASPQGDRSSGRGQPGVFRADVPRLDPDHHRARGRPGRVPGHPGQSLAGEGDHPGMVCGAELPADGQAQHVTVELRLRFRSPERSRIRPPGTPALSFRHLPGRGNPGNRAPGACRAAGCLRRLCPVSSRSPAAMSGHC